MKYLGNYKKLRAQEFADVLGEDTSLSTAYQWELNLILAKSRKVRTRDVASLSKPT